MRRLKLGVNVDHVATLRQARRAAYPDPVAAALLAERAGAGAITVHLREDRRHIQDADLFRLREAIRVDLNQEMAPVAEMVEIAMELRPDEVCIVPERREELTTEGGLDAAGMSERLSPMIDRMRMVGIGVSLFIDPEPHQVEAAARLGADFIELHTGGYAAAADAELAAAADAAKRDGWVGAAPRLKPGGAARAELERIRAAVKLGRARGLRVNAGHGLNYRNAGPIASLGGIEWLHIGHAIVARAVNVGMRRAVREMLALIGGAPSASRSPKAPAARRHPLT
jgi:pyridoxine 5-phosphate synthase